jgi:hypothetical protein
MPTKPNSFYSDIEPLKFDPLIYPIDAKQDLFYPDCICFTIQKRTGVSITDVTEVAGGVARAFVEDWKVIGKDNPLLQKKIEAAMNAESVTKADATRMKEIATRVTKEYEAGGGKLSTDVFDLLKRSFVSLGTGMRKRKELSVGRESRNILGSIYLNMPNGIQFNDKANWSGTELGVVGKVVQSVVGGGTPDAGTAAGVALGGAGALAGSAIGGLPALVSKLGISGGMFGMAIGAMAAAGPIQKGIESALGISQNPYMEMMFTGVGFRSFQFEFIMRPKSTPEVTAVAEILKMFRTFSRPTYTQGDLGKSFMDYPMEFGIEFLTAGANSITGMPGDPIYQTSFRRNKNVPQLKNCVCDNVSSNYTPQSVWAAHQGGVPVAVTLSLSFQETELVMAEDVWEEGY